MKRRRPLFWVILAAFVILAVWWVFTLPYQPERLYRAVPSMASFVSDHHHVARRWRDMAANPCVRSLLGGAGVTPAQIDQVMQDPAIERLVQAVAPRHTMVAYVPAYGLTAPSWVVASWIGWRAQLLRWGWLDGQLAGFQKDRLADGTRAWILQRRVGAQHLRVSLSVVDGVLLVCVGRDPTGVRRSVARLRRGVPMTAGLQAWLREERPADDRGWVRWLHRGAAGRRYVVMHYALTNVDAGAVRGWVDLPGEVPALGAPWSVTAAVRESSVGRLLGKAPDTLVVAPVAEVLPWLGSGGAEGQVTVPGLLSGLVRADGPLVAALCGGDYSGRVMGLRVPSLLVAARARDAASVLDAVTDAVDRLNAQEGWTMLARRIETDARTLVVLESAQEDMYSSLGEHERLVFTEEDGWLVFATNIDALERVLQDAPAAGDALRWQVAMGAGEGTGYAWSDLAESGKAVRNALAVYSLALAVGDSSGSAPTRKTLDEIREWIVSLQALGTGTAWAERNDDQWQIRFSFGAP